MMVELDKTGGDIKDDSPELEVSEWKRILIEIPEKSRGTGSNIQKMFFV